MAGKIIYLPINISEAQALLLVATSGLNDLSCSNEEIGNAAETAISKLEAELKKEVEPCDR